MSADSGLWMIRFYAPWCGHCKALDSVWKEAADEMQDEVHFGDIDATEEFGLARRFEVRSFPTVICISEGKLYHFDGSRTVESIKDFALNLIIHKDANTIPAMPNIFVIMYEKYSNKANTYLYQHPIFTCILLFMIGIVFGVCVTMLILEVFYYGRQEEVYEEEEEGIVEENVEENMDAKSGEEETIREE